MRSDIPFTVTNAVISSAGWRHALRSEWPFIIIINAVIIIVICAFSNLQ